MNNYKNVLLLSASLAVGCGSVPAEDVNMPDAGITYTDVESDLIETSTGESGEPDQGIDTLEDSATSDTGSEDTRREIDDVVPDTLDAGTPSTCDNPLSMRDMVDLWRNEEGLPLTADACQLVYQFQADLLKLMEGLDINQELAGTNVGRRSGSNAIIVEDDICPNTSYEVTCIQWLYGSSPNLETSCAVVEAEFPFRNVVALNASQSLSTERDTATMGTTIYQPDTPTDIHFQLMRNRSVDPYTGEDELPEVNFIIVSDEVVEAQCELTRAQFDTLHEQFAAFAADIAQ